MRNRLAHSSVVSIAGFKTPGGTSILDTTNNALQVNVVAGAAGGSTQVSIKEVLTSSGASVMDSTEGAIKVNVVAGPGVGSTTITVRQSTAADLNAAVVQGSTVWPVQVSSVSGVVAVAQNSTTWQAQVSGQIRVANSTIGDLLASVQQNSTVWQVQAKIQDSSGVGPNILGTRPSTGAQGLAVRSILNDLQSTCFSTIGNNSTSSTIVSSAASVRHKVYAYSITSTNETVNSLTFASSLANPLWTVALQSFSSGIAGANLAVTPPAWLFATEAGSPLVFKNGPSTGSYHLSFSYFSEA